MKKIFVSLCIIFLFISPLILSDATSSASSTLEQNVEKAQTVKDTIEKSQDTQYWEEKWDYLGNEWKNIFLKNQYVAAFDSFFTEISIVFQIVFGIPYSLSFLFLGVLILWIFIYFNLLKIMSVLEFSTGSNSFSLSGGISYLGSALICVIFAQFQVFEGIVKLLGRLVVSPEYVWTRLIVLFVIFLGFGVFTYLDRKLAAYLRLKRKAAKERSAEVSKKVITSFVNNFLNSSKN